MFLNNFVSEVLTLESFFIPIQNLLPRSTVDATDVLCTSTLVCLWNCEGVITCMVITGLSNNLVSLPVKNIQILNNLSSHYLHVLRMALRLTFHVKRLAFRLCIFTLRRFTAFLKNIFNTFNICDVATSSLWIFEV